VPLSVDENDTALASHVTYDANDNVASVSASASQFPAKR
jgi:hypothetical protein